MSAKPSIPGYMGYMAAHTSEIALGSASIAIPLHHPLHTAKASASVDQLSAGRLILGVASGDHPVEFSAFDVDPERRGEVFREHYEVIRRAYSTSFEPIRWSSGELRGADLIPKPTTQVIPMLVTGHSRQSLDWIARESAGRINYPRAPKMQRLIVEDWRMEVMKQCGSVYKPFTQSLYIDLSENPSTLPPHSFGVRLGRDHLRALLESLEEIGVDHVILNLKYGKRPAADVIEELGAHIVAQFGVKARPGANSSAGHVHARPRWCGSTG
ncbi:LLM class flavin-dependent oxidoreductase [Stutzerimonas stutzeri]|uniref:LLM class flavin-dependent oxidoreductase n=1 Tax=Stutzerimonas stutzeri TaxID=316 RepID=UPI001E605BBB|nr:LLM class flavin-dependent oxidoreductase [Stutzerimonas stutzeri]